MSGSHLNHLPEVSGKVVKDAMSRERDGARGECTGVGPRVMMRVERRKGRQKRAKQLSSCYQGLEDMRGEVGALDVRRWGYNLFDDEEKMKESKGPEYRIHAK
jgi:hypothetical protein